MIEIDYEEGQKLKLTHVCGVCGECLEVAWGGSFGVAGYVLRCGEDPTHEGYVKAPRSNVVPVYIQDNIDRKEKRKLVKEHGEKVGAVVAKYHGVTSLTEQDAALIVQSFWPDAPTLEVKKAAITCASYGLNPCMRHLYLIPYKDRKSGKTTWRQVLGIGATRLMASRRGSVGYADGPRVMTDDEQQAIRGVVEKDKWWTLCTVVDKHGLSATGYGTYPKHDDNLKGRDKGNTEQNMAFIRAERNALDKKFPGEMPAGLEVVDEAYMERPSIGEIIEGESKMVEEEELFPPIAPIDAEEEPKPKAIKRDTSLIKTKTDFDRACHEDFPEIDAGDRLRHTGYGSAMDVPDWETAYMELAGKMGAKVEKTSE